MLKFIGFLTVAYFVYKIIRLFVERSNERNRYETIKAYMEYSKAQERYLFEENDASEACLKNAQKFTESHEMYLEQNNLTLVLIKNVPSLYDGRRTAECIAEHYDKLPLKPTTSNNLFFLCVFEIGLSVWMAIGNNSQYTEDHLKTVVYKVFKCVMDSEELFDIMYNLYIDTFNQHRYPFNKIDREQAMVVVRKTVDDYESTYAITSEDKYNDAPF